MEHAKLIAHLSCDPLVLSSVLHEVAHLVYYVLVYHGVTCNSCGLSHNLVSWKHNVEHVFDSYTLPLEKRPRKLVVFACKAILVIDLKEYTNAGQGESYRECGFFRLRFHNITLKAKYFPTVFLLKNGFPLPEFKL
ncbi:Uncharacterized protein Adt_30689 [Abeliophyllum distichum]|uniref:Uncharacterized protein n=1 Tax=Abeliophyllum distichum TaxID=126358 RepID=A0ABD1RDR0_9LAMI